MTLASCAGCGAMWRVEPPLPRCGACGDGVLTAAEHDAHGEPEAAYACGLDATQAVDRVAQAAAEVPFACDGLAARALAASLQLCWWPVWWVDGQLDGRWQARAGQDYTVLSSHEVLRGGRWVTEPHEEVRIRWAPRVGEVQIGLDNVEVPALRDHGRWVARLGAPVGEPSPWTPRPEPVRLPELTPDEARADADAGFREAASRVVLEAIGADHIDEFVLHAQATDLRWTWCLQPVWVARYTDDAGATQAVWISGTTGRVHGPLYASTGRGDRVAGLTLLAGLATLALAGLVGLVGLVLIPLLLVAMLLGVAAALLCVGAGYAALITRRHNARVRRQFAGDAAR